MAIKRKHIKRTSSLRNSTIIVPVYRPGVNAAAHMAATTIKTGSDFLPVGTDIVTTSFVAPGVGILITHGSGAASEQVTWTIEGNNQFGEAVSDTGLVTDNSPVSAESAVAFTYVTALKIEALEATAATGAQTVALGHSGVATMKIGIPAKLNATSELLGVMASVHNHTVDQNCDGTNLTIENTELTNHTFTLATGTTFGSVTIGAEDSDIILWCVLAPTSSAL